MEHRNALALRFFWVNLLATVAVAAVMAGLLFAGVPPIAILGLIPTVLAASDNGIQYVRRAGKPLEGAVAWPLSAVMMGVTLVTTFIIATGSGALFTSGVGAVQIIVFLTLFGLISFLIIRFFMGLGARHECGRRGIT